MKPTLPLLALTASAFIAGCADNTPTRTSPSAIATNPDTDIRAVLGIRDRGDIDDAQAVKVIAALRGIPLNTAHTPTPLTVTPQPPAPVVTSVAIVPAPVVAVAAPDPITGRLRSVGSDSMDRIMEEWTKGFTALHPALRANHEGKGSSTAIPALLDERADFGPMSRPLKSEEITRFTQRFGYAPTVVRTAIDALAVYVHPENPLAKSGMTLRQLDAVFSSTRKRGGLEATTWGDLGLGGEWKSSPIHVYSRNSASGTYAFFREEVLQKGDFCSGAKMLAGSEEVVSAVTGDKFGIGYSGIGYRTAGVTALKVSKDTGSAFMEPDEVNALSGAYPISRALHIAMNRNPSAGATPLQRAFTTYILGPEGRGAVKREGYFPLPANEAAVEITKVTGAH